MSENPLPPSQTALTLQAVAPGGNALVSRTFLGLLVAQFLAAFNDQAIHAAAMFFAINTQALTERDAISLMPILFYAPWAIFCTVAGYLADRYSKRNALVAWKFAEVAITAVAMIGFWMGRNGYESVGPWVVLATVFLMGTHSAFFVPAKYGVMPEILPTHQLSKGNGILESLSFLAVILGTVSGGVLSYLYLGNEVVIGGFLFGLAIVGTVASVLIRRMPAANPKRTFPPYIYGPLVQNLRTLLSQRPLRLAVTGIAFFTFVVAFMRAAVYMLGESQNPRWDELKTSAVVGTVALGIGLGSPLAGWLSGRRVELRLVPLGAVGMIIACVAGAYLIADVPKLIFCIIAIGLCTGFYIVPLYTLLQHKAPKTSKGDMIATSNFINISGAISATLMFFLVVFVAQRTGLIPAVTPAQRTQLGRGTLTSLLLSRGRPVYFEITKDDGTVVTGGEKPGPEQPLTVGELVDHVFASGTGPTVVLEVAKGIDFKKPQQPGAKQRVGASRFEISGVTHYDLVPGDEEPSTDYDQRHLPRYLFLGAGGLTLLMLLTILGPLLRVRREGV
ncbi:MFS transporter [Fimbriiglobus ruber]|uniref:Putative 2-acylglycerophosphoethanolamine acyltransferase / acyl-acyl carrier protein synthetase n=1 Tax=Fimbriiglobus ruber TaxID=1908690 RepID=A0A225DL55_9BACT|nr:MFS transporter [Fimbriiglobus ruber]OWK41693.1 putative 2-acylglycerophosphoethanolamine acyltransferase / acyl-acyl carrier protein synthetase [Fimbriiglobus ruber]